MILKDKKLLKKALLFYALLNLAVYSVFHLSYNLQLEVYGIYIEYARLYVTRAWELFMPATASLVALSVYKRDGRRECTLFVFLIALTRLVFALPYYYIYFISLGFDTKESLLRSALFSLCAVLLLFGAVLTMVFLCLWREKKKSASKTKPFEAHIYTESAVLIAVIMPFFYLFIKEAFDTVNVLIDYGTSLRIDEILYMSFNYLFLAALLVICYYVLIRQIEKLDKKLGVKK